MTLEFACRTPNCKGSLRGAPAGDTLTCPTCGRVYRLTRKPPREREEEPVAAPATGPEDESESAAPEPPQAATDRQKRKRRKRRKKSAGFLNGVWAFCTANSRVLLTRVLPGLVLVIAP